jgi:hypothetical protein
MTQTPNPNPNKERKKGKEDHRQKWFSELGVKLDICQACNTEYSN